MGDPSGNSITRFEVTDARLRHGDWKLYRKRGYFSKQTFDYFGAHALQKLHGDFSRNSLGARFPRDVAAKKILSIQLGEKKARGNFLLSVGQTFLGGRKARCWCNGPLLHKSFAVSFVTSPLNWSNWCEYSQENIGGNWSRRIAARCCCLFVGWISSRR